MTSTDTHTYDAKWQEELKNVNIAHDAFFSESLTEVVNEAQINIVELSTMSTDVKNQALSWRAQMLNAGGGNADSANAVDASDILHRVERAIRYRLHLHTSITTGGLDSMDIDDIDRICTLYKLPKSGDIIDFGPAGEHPTVVSHDNLAEMINDANISIINAYVEQLSDVQNGACAQGRTTRLFQIYASFYE